MTSNFELDRIERRVLSFSSEYERCSYGYYVSRLHHTLHTAFFRISGLVKDNQMDS